MTVYVDDMYTVPMGEFRRMKMSHMMADTDAELHAMADAIGIERRWYQRDHYDISITKRKFAIRNGAVEISMRQMAAYSALRRRFGVTVPPSHAAIFRYGKDYPL
mgnify:CR=1 FL=1